MTVKEHYDNHLAGFYAWMIGEFQEKQQGQEQLLRAQGIFPMSNACAIDLGCGHGLQAISLARMGFTVQAVDFCAALLKALEEQIDALSIHCHHEDIIKFLKSTTDPADCIVCMGDTVTHLPDINALTTLIIESYRLLVTGGHLVFSFRALAEPLEGVERFIRVRADDQQIHTCFLEYLTAHVHVYDILHIRTSPTSWRQQVSWYPKLKLSQAMVTAMLEANGFTIKHVQIQYGMIYLYAYK